MSDLSDQDVTGMLGAWNLGQQEALTKLIPAVYRELRRLAHSYMSREGREHTLETTGLIHETYLRLAELHGIEWCDRRHFYAVSASLMRRILVDWARSRKSEKRGGRLRRVELDEAVAGYTDRDLDLITLALDDALQRLADLDERKSRVVELRFFAGLGITETARVLQISTATVARDWEFSKVWLLREIEGRSQV